MTIIGSESLGGLHRSPPGTRAALAIQTIDCENDPSKLEIFFGPFRLLQARRLLLKGNEPVSVSGRAFDLLIALVERPGEVVSKSELIAKVWPQTFVAEGNLKVRIAALRRVLAGGQPGDRYISTIVGRGYCLSRRSLGRVAGARRPGAAEALGFVEPAELDLRDVDVPIVVDICRRPDGDHSPIEVEFATTLPSNYDPRR